MRKKILLVGTGDSIFLVNYVTALKKCMDVVIFVYSPQNNKGNYEKMPYDYVTFDSFYGSKWQKFKYVYFIILPFVQLFHFYLFIKDKKFDIIHIHRVIPAWVIVPKLFLTHCNRLLVSFWGGECEKETILLSHRLYLSRLKYLLRLSDSIIGANDIKVEALYPFVHDKLKYGVFGSSIIDYLCTTNFNKVACRLQYGIDQNKISVLLGYSGKRLHNHREILKSIVENPKYSKWNTKIHFLASMTRGATLEQILDLEKALQQTSSSFTLIRNCYQSDIDVAKFRLSTDILFQLSDFDYLSASVKENLCAGVIMISGSWLPYQILQDDGFYFENVDSIEEGVERFFSILENFNSYKDKAFNNISLSNERYSWQACIKDWIKYYD